MKSIARICIDHQMLGWALVLLLSIPPILGFAGFRMGEPLHAGWVPPEVIAQLHASETKFKSRASVVLVLECDDFFTAKKIQALQSLAAELRATDHIDHLTWMGDVPLVNLRGSKRLLLPVVSDETTAEELAESKRELLQHPLVAGHLISADGNTVLMLLDSAECAVVQNVRTIARKALDPVGVRARVTGILALYDVHDRTLLADHERIQFTSYLLVGLLQLLIFRRFIAIVLSCSGPVIGVIWTLGWLRLTGQSENELAKIILPVVVLMIGFTDSVHLVMRLRQLRHAGQNTRDAVYQSVIQTGPACFLTSLTTAIGFGSLMLSESEMISGFGCVSAIGVIVTFLALILVTPLLSASWLGHKMHISKYEDPLSRLMARMVPVVNFSLRKARAVTALGIVITIFCLAACGRLVPDDRVSDRVPQASEERLAMQHCDKQIGGIRSLRLFVTWEEESTRKQIWDVVQKCEHLIEREELLGPPLSVRTAMSVIAAPKGRDRSVLVSRLPDDFKSQFYRSDIRTALVFTRMQDLGIARLEPVIDQLSDELRKLESQSPGFELQLVSDVVIEGQVVSQLIHEMLDSLLLAAIVIFCVLGIAFRSVKVGLISIIPNLMPLGASGALRLFMSDSLGIAGTCSFAICLGIAVDDTIHYLWHFREERRRGVPAEEANRRTFITVGSALMVTTVVMTAGLATVMTSRLPPHVNFAAMACMTLLIALPADLFFLPAVLAQFPSLFAVESPDSTEPSSNAESTALAKTEMSETLESSEA